MDHSRTIERRASQRRRILKGGKVQIPYLGVRVDCVVRNVSDTGACLVVDSPVGIPDAFDLFMHNSANPMNCRVVWRSGGKVGVEFQNIAPR